MESVSDAVTAVAVAAVTPMARAPLATSSAIVAGLALHLAGQLARARAWVAIVRRAAPDADAGSVALVTAWMVGAGASGVLPSRAGDGVRLVLARRHVPGAGYPLLAGTLVAETALSTVLGALTLVWAISHGLPHRPPAAIGLVAAHPVLASGAVAAVAAAVTLTRRAWARRARDAAAGLRVFRCPSDYARSVASWQLLGRALELGSLACLLAAFGLPATLATALLALAAQGTGHTLTAGPLGAGVSTVALGYALSAHGGPVAVSAVAAFMVGTTTLETILGLGLAVVLLARSGLPRSPRALRAALAER